jgi:hypothetical protein
VLQIPTWNPSSGLECINLTEKEHLFEMGVMRARVAVRYFCKLFMKQMEISGYSVWRTLQALDPDATFAKQEHTAYALESNLNKVFFFSPRIKEPPAVRTVFWKSLKELVGGFHEITGNELVFAWALWFCRLCTIALRMIALMI